MKPKPDPEMIDDEDPEWTAETTAKAMTFEQLPPTLHAKLRGGRPRVADPKTVVTLRLRASALAPHAAGDSR